MSCGELVHPWASLGHPAARTMTWEEGKKEEKDKKKALARTRTWDLSHLMSFDSPKRES